VRAAGGGAGGTGVPLPDVPPLPPPPPQAVNSMDKGIRMRQESMGASGSVARRVLPQDEANLPLAARA
jgi:hypothetical protein